jgi:hypothetical protein
VQNNAQDNQKFEELLARIAIERNISDEEINDIREIAINLSRKLTSLTLLEVLQTVINNSQNL